VQVVHTSAKYEGQVYIPEINYILMIACIAITIGFKTTTQIGNAYGNSSNYNHIILYDLRLKHYGE
jgi:K+ transporter